jgi:hypothetical protein
MASCSPTRRAVTRDGIGDYALPETARPSTRWEHRAASEVGRDTGPEDGCCMQ